MKLNSALICLLLAVFTASAHAQITNTGTLTEQTELFEFNPVAGPSFPYAQSIATVNVASPLGPFATDFGPLGDTTWSVTWQVPAGQVLEIEIPEGFDNETVQFRLSVQGISAAGGQVIQLDSVTPVYAPGSPAMPTPNVSNTNMFLTGPGGQGMSLLVYYNGFTPGTTYRLTSLTGTGTIPASYAEDIDSLVRAFEVQGELYIENQSVDPADPGQWIRVVPEPTSLALLGLGGLIVARRRR